MEGVMGSIYSGDPGVDSLHRILYLISYHLISLYNEIHILSFPSFHLTRSFRDSMWIHANACILTAGKYHTFSPSSYAPRARTTLSHEFLLDPAIGAVECWWWALGQLPLLLHHTGQREWSRPKLDLMEGIMTLAYDIRPEATLLIGLS